jgi:peptidoglycan/LPS O-acetylase OafA/YrhL
MEVTPLGYVRQLDGVRALAVILVIISHWFPGDIAGKLGLGAIGVDIFFVLSGFLITRILIVERLNYELKPSAHSRLKAIRNFMVRRSLRIFPIYYLLLVLLIVFKEQFPNPVSLDWEWYFFYLQNILFYINQAWPGGKLSHLWSLAVEEQFYLFWPWLILFVSQKWMLRLILLSFLIGIGSVYFLPTLHRGSMAEVLTPTCMQAFASGGILAYFHVKKGSDFHQLKYHFLIPGLLSFAYFIMGLNGVLPLLVDFRTIVSIFMVGLIATILINPNFFISSKILGNPALVFLGKISYGVYLFHNFVPLLVNSLLHYLDKHYLSFSVIKYNEHLYGQGFLFYFFCFIVLICFSTLIFTTYEKRFQKFKKYF